MERPSTSKPRGLCNFYETPRGCFAGKNCKFLHGQDEKLTPYDKNKTCRYYRAGYCKRGDECWFLHVDGSEAPSPPGSDAECIICYEKPITYGLMDGCSHVLCVQCIRQWRHPNNRSDDAETTNISCPYCRVPSYFVTPSSQYFPKDHPRRVEIIAQYKASMARVACKHFQNSPPNRRHCPFGRNCFYQHLNADGTPYIFPENSNPHRWIRARDLDDLSASLERLRRSIPEVFGEDAPHTDQQRRLLDLALDVGRTLNRLNFPQSEAFNPLGILLAHHLSQLEEAQRDTTEGTEDNSTGGDQPRPEVADGILAASNEAIPREGLQPESADDNEQVDENSGTSDGTIFWDSRSSDPSSLPGGIPIDSIRVDFTPGSLRFTIESTIGITSPGNGQSGSRDDQSTITNTAAEVGSEVGTSNQTERLSDAVDEQPQVEALKAEGHLGSSGDGTPETPPTSIYHDPYPPFETDGRGRVVRSNPSQQARLRSRSSPPAQPRKSSNDETNDVKEKNDPVARPGTQGRIHGDIDGDRNGDHRGPETGAEGASATTGVA